MQPTVFQRPGDAAFAWLHLHPVQHELAKGYPSELSAVAPRYEGQGYRI
jgi:hypothetical protein